MSLNIIKALSLSCLVMAPLSSYSYEIQVGQPVALKVERVQITATLICPRYDLVSTPGFNCLEDIVSLKTDIYKNFATVITVNPLDAISRAAYTFGESKLERPELHLEVIFAH